MAAETGVFGKPRVKGDLPASAADLPWRYLVVASKLWWPALWLMFGLAMVCSFATLLHPAFFQGAVAGLIGLCEVTTYVAAALWRGVCRDQIVRDMLATPMPSEAYCSAIMRLFRRFALGYAAISTTTVGCMSYARGAAGEWVAVVILIYLFLACSVCCWSAVFGIRRFLLALAIPGSAFAFCAGVAIYLRAQFLAGPPRGSAHLTMISVQWSVGCLFIVSISAVLMFFLTFYRISRCRWHYAELLRDRM